MISLATANITQKVRDNIQACLEEGRIGSGRFVTEFEEKAKKLLQIKHAIAVCNGTMADIVALACLKHLRPLSTEVIVPALTFIAHTNSVFINGLRPVFVDVKEDYQINVGEIEKCITSKTLAIFPVHLLGRNADMKAIKEMADRYGVYVVEDCCEAWKTPITGDFGTYSFFPSHTVTTGEGGMLTTNNDDLAALVRKMINHGRRGEDILNKFHFDFVGFNGKMSNLTAAVGAATIDDSDEIIGKRKRNVEIYNSLLSLSWYAASPHCYPFLYESTEQRNEALIRLEQNDIEARTLFSCIPTDEYKLPGFYPQAKMFGDLGLFLPIHQDLTEADIKKICELL